MPLDPVVNELCVGWNQITDPTRIIPFCLFCLANKQKSIFKVGLTIQPDFTHSLLTNKGETQSPKKFKISSNALETGTLVLKRTGLSRSPERDLGIFMAVSTLMRLIPLKLSFTSFPVRA